MFFSSYYLSQETEAELEEGSSTVVCKFNYSYHHLNLYFNMLWISTFFLFQAATHGFGDAKHFMPLPHTVVSRQICSKPLFYNKICKVYIFKLNEPPRILFLQITTKLIRLYAYTGPNDVCFNEKLWYFSLHSSCSSIQKH